MYYLACDMEQAPNTCECRPCSCAQSRGHDGDMAADSRRRRSDARGPGVDSSRLLLHVAAGSRLTDPATAYLPDLDDLGEALVSLCVVANPFGAYRPADLRECFPDLVPSLQAASCRRSHPSAEKRRLSSSPLLRDAGVAGGDGSGPRAAAPVADHVGRVLRKTGRAPGHQGGFSDFLAMPLRAKSTYPGF